MSDTIHLGGSDSTCEKCRTNEQVSDPVSYWESEFTRLESNPDISDIYFDDPCRDYFMFGGFVAIDLADGYSTLRVDYAGDKVNQVLFLNKQSQFGEVVDKDSAIWRYAEFFVEEWCE